MKKRQAKHGLPHAMCYIPRYLYSSASGELVPFQNQVMYTSSFHKLHNYTTTIPPHTRYIILFGLNQRVQDKIKASLVGVRKIAYHQQGAQCYTENPAPLFFSNKLALYKKLSKPWYGEQREVSHLTIKRSRIKQNAYLGPNFFVCQREPFYSNSAVSPFGFVHLCVRACTNQLLKLQLVIFQLDSHYIY